VKKNILTGLSTLIPFVVTILTFRFFLNKLTKPFVNTIKYWLVEAHFVQGVKELAGFSFLLHIAAQVLIILGLILFITFVGFLIRIWALDSLPDVIQRWIHKLPFISKIYDPIAKTIKILLDPKKKVVHSTHLTPFPSSASYMICFKMNEFPIAEIEKKLQEQLDLILIPTVPNPLMGFVLFYRSKDSHKIQASVEDVLKFNISCGLLQPETIFKQAQ
jgi:uncharacterized membrane protein